MEAEVFIDLLEGVRWVQGDATTITTAGADGMCCVCISTFFHLGAEDCYAHLLWNRNLSQQGREDADRFWLFR